MTPKIQTVLARIKLYLERAEVAFNHRSDLFEARPHLAELAENRQTPLAGNCRRNQAN